MIERINQLPKYQTCRLCKNSLNQGCVEECIPKDNFSWFEFKRGTNLEDLPPFPLIEFKTKMSNDVRRVILAEYLSKVLDYLQGRNDDRQYSYYPASRRLPEDIKK